MYLENLVLDAVDPRRLGRFWEEALGGETLVDTADDYETRLSLHGDDGTRLTLDLCLERVSTPPAEPLRLHLDLRGGAERDEVARRLRDLGAHDLDVGQGDVPWLVLADPEGNPFCVLEERATDARTGPVAALPLDSADPERDGAFWAHLTGWGPTPGVAPVTLRHPSGLGPLLELCPEGSPHGSAKNRWHLDVRLEAGDDPDEVLAWVLEHGGARYEHDWGDLPWQVVTDPSGNVLCLLPSRD